ncbi:Wzz/FepE/Etk N-terminal domain-containing protein [Vibrio kyushuensis]|uniref:Wzz/FepE/Etk N-terminal domain-containing protein n=1 Tax=Vibrio kyushuensis TaxID=2910249 RepID=UPI003D0DC8A9
MKQVGTNYHSPDLPELPRENPSFEPRNDDVDLFELFGVLLRGKWVVTLTALVVSTIAVVYAITAQEWWTSRARITLPQTQDYSQYRLQIKQFQPLFDIYSDKGTLIVSDALDDLVDSEAIFLAFITAFNSNQNKKDFLDNNPLFNKIKGESGLPLEASTSLYEVDEATRRLYREWFGRLLALKVKGYRDEVEVFDVSMQATTKSDSYKMLNDYVLYVSRLVQRDLLLNLQALITSKKNELLQQKSALNSQAKQMLEVEIRRAEYALDIAKSANVSEPIQDLGEQEIFSISLGYDAIKAKISALKSVNNLSLIDPRLHQVESKLLLLQNTQINRNVEFNTFRYLERPQQPLDRDAPKRVLLVLGGGLLGLILGVAIVLVRYALSKEDNH